MSPFPADATLTPEQRALQEHRYGHHGRPVGLYVTGAVVGAVFLGWLLWAAWLYANPDLRFALTGYSGVTADAVTVRFTVHKPADRTATCTVRALDFYRNEVGRATVEIPAGQADAAVAYTLTTTSRPVSAQVSSCSLG